MNQESKEGPPTLRECKEILSRYGDPERWFDVRGDSPTVSGTFSALRDRMLQNGDVEPNWKDAKDILDCLTDEALERDEELNVHKDVAVELAEVMVKWFEAGRNRKSNPQMADMANGRLHEAVANYVRSRNALTPNPKEKDEETG